MPIEQMTAHKGCVIFYQSGSITIQTPTFAGSFGDPKTAADCVGLILNGAGTWGWESDEDSRMSDDDLDKWERAGLGMSYTFDDIREIISNAEPIETVWRNEREFFETIGVVVLTPTSES